MKKLFNLVLIVFLGLSFIGCGKSDADAVKEFAVRFGNMVESHDDIAISDVYPNADLSSPYSMEFDESRIEIFPEGDNRYTIKYGNGASVTVRVGLENAVEVIGSEGIFNEKSPKQETEVAVGDEATVNDVDKSEFVAQFKKNIKADSEWEDDGWNDNDNSGNCHIYVNNKNSFPVDGSDYYITFKYEYLYEMGADMYSETVKKNGKELPANGKAKFTHYYTDDCGPLDVKVKFNLTDDQIYNKYAK